MAKLRPYLIATHLHKPAENVNTSVAGWTESGMIIDEQVEFVTKIKKNQLTSASVIIDILGKEVVKHRFEKLSKEEVIEYYFDKYKEHISQIVVQYMMQHGNMPPIPSFDGKENMDDGELVLNTSDAGADDVTAKVV